jgi:hypothetical protein
MTREWDNGTPREQAQVSWRREREETGTWEEGRKRQLRTKRPAQHTKKWHTSYRDSIRFDSCCALVAIQNRHTCYGSFGAILPSARRVRPAARGSKSNGQRLLRRAFDVTWCGFWPSLACEMTGFLRPPWSRRPTANRPAASWGCLRSRHVKCSWLWSLDAGARLAGSQASC